MLSEPERSETLDQLYRAIVAAAPDAIVLVDAAGRVLDCNGRAEALFGWPRKDLAGRHVAETILPRLELGRPATADPRPRPREVSAARRNGGAFTARLDVVTLAGAGGPVHALFLDEPSAAERAEAQRLQAQKMEALTQVTSGVAHDFNNLLTVVIGNLDLLCESLRGHAELEIAEVALRGALRGADLANRLLAFARRQPLQPRPVDLNRLVADMEGVLRRALGEGIELTLKLDPGVSPLMADPAPIEAALANLAANARDAMPGGGRVTIETANIDLDEGDAAANPEATPGAYAMLAMSDTGSGIDPEVLPRVFEPFFTTKRRSKGTGLGLSSVYGFVRQAGGHVTIESRRDSGTTVRLYLPRARPEDGAVDGPEPAEDLSARGETILVVDDIEETRRADAASLAEFGYRVIEAESGREALERLREDPGIDVLLADMVMAGGMPGMELAAEAHKLRPGLKAVLTTGIATMSLAVGRPAMPHEILPRPHRRVDLGRVMRRVLSS